MLKKLLFVFLAALSLSGMFALTAGDIAIIGVNADATKSMAFVALEDIPVSTIITFTDNAWNATTETWRTGEGSFEWSNSSATPKGTVVVISLATTFTASVGSVTTNASFSLSASGDQILAYEGSTAPATNSATTWLFGFSLENWAWADNSNTSDIPTALAGYSVAMTTSTTEIDNAYFANGATAQTTVSVSGTKAALIALFTDNTKYYLDNIGPLTFPTYTITVSSGSTPTITATGTLNAFSTYTGTASTAQSYTVTGSNLTEDIIVTPPTGYEMSSNGTTYLSSLTLASTYDGLVYIRLIGTTAGTYNGNISHTSTGATQVDKAVTGTVSDPSPVIHTTGTLNAFSTETGTPSAAQTYTLSGEFLTADIIVTPPAGYELSTNGSTYLSSLTLASTFDNLVYVRLTGTTEGTYNGNITHTSTGAPQVDLAVTGEVIAATVPTLLLEENFAYTVGTTAVSNGWSAHSGAGTAQPLIDATNLSYTNYPPNAGGSAGTTGVTGEDISKAFTAQTTGSIYAAFLINITSLPNVTQDYFFHLGDSTVPTGGTTYFRGKLYAQRNASNNIRFGISKTSANTTVIQWTGGLFTGGTYDYAMGTTYLMVVKYNMVAGVANDEVSLWINPTNMVSEPATTLFIGTADTAADPPNIGSVAIRQSANTPAAYYDGIRITNDWAQLWEEAPTPIIVTEGVPDPVYNISGNPSEEVSSYNLSGTNLMGNINLVAPEHFEISTSATEGWNTSLSVPSSFDAPIYVRMNSSTVGEHAGDITHNSTGAEEVLVRAEGETFPADVTWNVTSTMTAFAQELGTPSDAQSYTLSASNATGDITVSVAAPFELSTTGSGNWLAELTLTYNFNGSVYVRLNAMAAGDYNENILHVTANATNYELAVSGVTAPPAGSYASELFFSEYIEGSSNNKAIEIFNGTGSPVDLSNYQYENWYNGGSTVLLVSLTGTLANGDVFVIAHPSANATILAIADLTSTNVSFNGNDALALRKLSTDTLVDIFGRIGENPGTAWGTAPLTTINQTLVRKATVTGGVTTNPTSGFPTLTTEWDAYAQDTTTYLGSHTFTPGLTPAAAPTFDPGAGIYFSTQNVTISTVSEGTTIRYTIDGSTPTETNGTIYTVGMPVSISATTTLKAVAYGIGYAISSVSEALYIIPVDVADIATLRTGSAGVYYRLTGVGVLSFKQTYRNQKYIQDPTAGILIDDLAIKITSTYNLYDGIRYIIGTVGEFGGMKQFTPVADPGAAYSTGNTITPQVITLSELVANFENYESELVKVSGVTFDTADGIITFANGTLYPMNTAAMDFRTTFYDMDYIGTIVPTGTVNITGIPNSRVTEGNNFTARYLTDFETAGGLEIPVVAISEAGGTITLTWDAVAGATSYRIEHSDNPYAGYTTLNTTANLTYQVPAGAMKWFRVFAVQ